MRSLIVVAFAACLCAVAMADGYGYSSYGNSGYGGYDSYGGGYNAYYGGAGVAGYGSGYGSGYGHGYGKRTGRSRTVVVPYPVPVQQPTPVAGGAFPAAGLGVNELIGLENESSNNGLFGSDGTGLLFLLFLIPLLFSSNTSG